MYFLRFKNITILAFCCLIVFHYITLLEYPIPTCDESFYGMSAIKYYSSVTNLGTWTGLSESFYMFHGRLYWFLIGFLFSLVDVSLFAARLLSFVGLILLMLATFLIGCSFDKFKTGLWSSLLLGVSYLVMYSSHLVRPDILAAAIGALLVWWMKYTLDNPHWIRFLILGIFLILQLEIHVINLHLILPILSILYVSSRKQDFPNSLSLNLGVVCGMILGILIVLFFRYGNYGDLIAFFSDLNLSLFFEFITGSQFVSTENIVADNFGFVRFAKFWWNSYGWTPPFVALLQALLFIFALIRICISRSSDLRRLFGLVVLSSLTFIILNNNHAWLGYSVLWLPYYFVLVVASVGELDILGKIKVLGISGHDILLIVLFLTYVIGDVYLLSGNNFNLSQRYLSEGKAIVADIPSNSRVLAKQYWWYAIHNDIVYLDEHLIAYEGSLPWWVGVPEKKLDKNMVTNDGMQIYRQFDELQVDYVVTDGVLGCSDIPDVHYKSFEAVLESKCELIDSIDSSLYNTQRLYKCSM